jgi:hypothetical protein
MEEPEQGNSAQNHKDLEAYQSWRKKDHCARFTMLSSMHNDLIGKFESYGTTQDMWIALKAKFGETTVTRLRALTLKFDTFRMQRGDSMQEHLRKMSAMVRELKATGNNLTDGQQIQAVICSLPDSWEQMKLNMTHNESIQTLEDLSRHLELEVEHRVAQGQSSANTTKRPRGKRGGRKQAEQACFNCGVVGHFARDCTKPKKILFDPFSCTVCYVASSQVLIAYSILDRIVDTGEIDHVARDRVGFVEYRRVPAGNRWMRMGNESRVEVLGIGTYKLQLHLGCTLLLHDVLYAPGMRQNLLLVNVLLKLGFSFGFHGRSVDIFWGPLILDMLLFQMIICFIWILIALLMILHLPC